MIYKVDQYNIRHKGRDYRVLMFPKHDKAWGYDNTMEDGQMMIDADLEYYKLIIHAIGALLNDPYLLIYIPIGKSDCKMFRQPATYDAVLESPLLQLKRSSWYDIRKKINKSHYAGKYKISYDSKKIIAYYKANLSGWKNRYKFKNDVLTDLLGNTVFFIMPKNVLYKYFYYIADGIEDYANGKFWNDCIYAGIGYILNDKKINEFLEIGIDEDI